MRVVKLVVSVLTVIAVFGEGPKSSTKRIIMLPTMFASHILEMSQLGRELVRRGHDVHMVLSETTRKMPDMLKKSGIKFLYYPVDYDADPFDDQELFNASLNNWIKGSGSANEEIETDFATGTRECGSLLKCEELFNTIVSMKFDIAVVDGFGPTLCRYIIPYQAGIPYGSLTAVIWPYMSTIGTLPSIVVGLYSKTGDTMGFFGRISNLLSHYEIWKTSESYYNHATFSGSFVENKPYKSLTDLSRNSLFWILETEGLMDYNRIFLPHIHYVGGLSTNPANPLTGKFRELTEKATDGLIIISFGTRITYLPQVYISRFLEGLDRVDKKYTIIFKYDGQINELSVPKNVHIFQWIPQNDILGHKNTRLFITHCGNNGRYEALYHGIPMLAFPFDADQPINAVALEGKRQGIRMDMKTFTVRELEENVHEMLNNPEYKQNIQRASRIFRDFPNPRERGALVVEQVMKHGADHWRMPANELSIFQITMLDIAAFMACILLLFIGVCFSCVGLLISKSKLNKKIKNN